MAATDRELYKRSDTVKGPARRLFAITKHDTNELTYITKGIYVGGTGDIAVMGVDDSVAVTLSAVPAGTVLPIRAKQVLSTGTTATLIVGLA